MIVYGSYYTRFKKYALHDTTCPNCCRENTMYLSAGCRTYHLMFIPFFPGAKQITQRCWVCKSEYYPFPDKKEAADRMAAETRRPWYLFFLLWAIAAIGVLAAVMVSLESIRGNAG
jgi:hypothetical protein